MAGLNSIREAYQQVYDQLDERMSDDEKEMRRLAAQERRAGKSDRLDSKVASKYADSEKKSADREDKKSKGKHIYGVADSVEVDGEVVEAVYGGEKKRPEDKRMTVTAADKKGNTSAWQKYKAGDKRYKAASHVGEAKDDSYLEPDMKKRKKNNEKAIEDMKKVKDTTVPRWMKEDLDVFDVVLEFLQVEGYADTLEEAQELMTAVVLEAQAARNNPEKYERESRKSETKGQSAERRVRDRLKTMDPKRAEAMKAQMRAVGLNV